MSESRSTTGRRWFLVLSAVIVVGLLPWWLLAYPRRMVAAWIDGHRGRDEILAFGLQRPASRERARLLSALYGVETRRVAGCVVSQELVSYVNGYNAVARSRINARFGKDVFAECIEQSESAPGPAPSEK